MHASDAYVDIFDSLDDVLTGASAMVHAYHDVFVMVHHIGCIELLSQTLLAVCHDAIVSRRLRLHKAVGRG